MTANRTDYPTGGEYEYPPLDFPFYPQVDGGVSDGDRTVQSTVIVVLLVLLWLYTVCMFIRRSRFLRTTGQRQTTFKSKPEPPPPATPVPTATSKKKSKDATSDKMSSIRTDTSTVNSVTARDSRTLDCNDVITPDIRTLDCNDVSRMMVADDAIRVPVECVVTNSSAT